MIPAWYALAMAGAFLGLLVLQELAHRAERRELYSRLMARSLPEYAALASSTPPKAGLNPIKRSLERHKNGQASLDDDE